MTREEAKKMFRDDKNSQGCYKAVLTKIDKIYDAFEEQIKQGQSLPIHSVVRQSEQLCEVCNENKAKVTYNICRPCEDTINKV